MVSEENLNEIRARIDISELVGEYVTLKRLGQSFVGICPFHKEKTPSFHVNPSKQIFHCFGCHKGGDIYSFYSAMEGTNFPETVKRLAERCGITLDNPQTPKVRKTVGRAHLRLHEILEWAAKYYHYLLLETSEYREVVQYLKKRGISKKTAEKFRLGVAPRGWHTLRDLMLKRGFKLPELVHAGLVIDQNNPQGYDRFRYRLMFPIRAPKGEVLGFGARLVEDEPNQPKYLNSPESPLFSKRTHLYGLYENQREIRLRKELLLVEGYMDVVGLYEKGVTNSAATMGTALTEEHGTLIRSFAQKVVTVFDPDPAGREAWRRSVHLLMERSIFAKDLELPDGEDPDEYVKKHGAETFYSLCEKAPRQITKLLKEIAGQGPLSEEQKAKILSDLTPVLIATRKLPDRALLWDSISLVLNISLASLKELSQGQVKPAQAEAPPKNPINRATEPPHAKHDPLEEEFLRAALANAKWFHGLEGPRWERSIKSSKLLKILKKIHDAREGSAWEQALTSLAHNQEDALVASLASAALVQSDTSKAQNSDPKWLDDIMLRIERRTKELEIRAISAQIRLSQQLGNEAEQIRLLEKLNELRSGA